MYWIKLVLHILAMLKCIFNIIYVISFLLFHAGPLTWIIVIFETWIQHLRQIFWKK